MDKRKKKNCIGVIVSHAHCGHLHLYKQLSRVMAPFPTVSASDIRRVSLQLGTAEAVGPPFPISRARGRHH